MEGQLKKLSPESLKLRAPPWGPWGQFSPFTLLGNILGKCVVPDTKDLF